MTSGSRRERFSASRAVIAALLFVGVTLTVGLAAAPHIHAWLHKSDSGTHECAATLMSKGTWDQSACEPILKAPEPTPVSRSFLTPGVRVIARAASSILEHAPPANS